MDFSKEQRPYQYTACNQCTPRTQASGIREEAGGAGGVRSSGLPSQCPGNLGHRTVNTPRSSYTERGGKKCFSEWFQSPVLRTETAEDQSWHALEEKLRERVEPVAGAASLET